MNKRKKITASDERFMMDFYTAHKSYMLHTAMKFTDSPADCEDILQDTMVRLMRNVDSLRHLSANQAGMYLFLTIRSVFADREKTAQERTQPVSDDSLELLDVEQGINEDGINAKWDTEILKETLPPKDWKLLELKYIAGYSDQEIAKELHYAPDSVRTMLRRARQRARAVLSNKKH